MGYQQQAFIRKIFKRREMRTQSLRRVLIILCVNFAFSFLCDELYNLSSGTNQTPVAKNVASCPRKIEMHPIRITKLCLSYNPLHLSKVINPRHSTFSYQLAIAVHFFNDAVKYTGIFFQFYRFPLFI